MKHLKVRAIIDKSLLQPQLEKHPSKLEQYPDVKVLLMLRVQLLSCSCTVSSRLLTLMLTNKSSQSTILRVVGPVNIEASSS